MVCCVWVWGVCVCVCKRCTRGLMKQWPDFPEIILTFQQFTLPLKTSLFIADALKQNILIQDSYAKISPVNNSRYNLQSLIDRFYAMILTKPGGIKLLTLIILRDLCLLTQNGFAERIKSIVKRTISIHSILPKIVCSIKCWNCQWLL